MSNSTIVLRPDADPEVSSVDGLLYHISDNDTWANIRGGVGTLAQDNLNYAGIYMDPEGVPNGWDYLSRAIIVFPTNLLPEAAVISEAILYLYGYSKQDETGIAPDINIYSAAPASDAELTAGDYDSLGTIAYCDTPITYANWSITGYNSFILNATGLAAISKTSPTAIGIRNANYDVANIEPPNVDGQYSGLDFFTSEQGYNYAPKLMITYSSLGVGKYEITVLEALRNIEMSAMGRVYVDEQGCLKYENRYARNP